MAVTTDAAAATRAQFETATRAYAHRLHSISLAILYESAEAEDALQEAMEHAWRSWDRVRDPAAREAWLLRICVRRSLHHRRGLTRRWILADARREDRSALVDLRPGDLDLDRAYRRLSRGQRAAVALHYQHGYTLRECAGLMGCRSATVRGHLAGALTALRAELSDG